MNKWSTMTQIARKTMISLNMYMIVLMIGPSDCVTIRELAILVN